jgi:ribosomal protein L17
VFVLLIVVVVVAVPVLYAADRIIKAHARARRVRSMSERLTAATQRADVQHERQQEVAQASAELTSVMPAISRPPLTLPDEDPGQPTS